MTIRVLHIIGGGEIGGAEQHVLNLCMGFDQSQVTPFLVCLLKESPFADLVKTKITTRVFPMRFLLDLSPILSVVKFCRQNNIQLIHCHGIRANLIGRLASLIIKVSCISTIHSLPQLDYISSAKARLFLTMDNLTLPFSSGIIAISAYLRDYIVKRLEKRNLSIPVKVIYNGIDEHDFSLGPAMGQEFRRQWNIPQDRYVIGTIGRLHPVKGHTFLIEALKHVYKANTNIHLLLIGDGPLQTQLSEKLKSSGIPYTLTGHLPMAWRSLPAMDLFVLPSLSEGMGIVLLEAAQAKIPIIASQVGGIPELIEDKTEGLLVKPGDVLGLTLAISDLIQNIPLAQKVIANAAERAKQFTYRKMAVETTALYEELLR